MQMKELAQSEAQATEKVEAQAVQMQELAQIEAQATEKVEAQAMQTQELEAELKARAQTHSDGDSDTEEPPLSGSPAKRPRP